LTWGLLTLIWKKPLLYNPSQSKKENAQQVTKNIVHLADSAKNKDDSNK